VGSEELPKDITQHQDLGHYCNLFVWGKEATYIERIGLAFSPRR